jgi:hypothetical protein
VGKAGSVDRWMKIGGRGGGDGGKIFRKMPHPAQPHEDDFNNLQFFSFLIVFELRTSEKKSGSVRTVNYLKFVIIFTYEPSSKNT